MPPTPEEIEAAAQAEREAQQEAIDELALQDEEDAKRQNSVDELELEEPAPDDEQEKPAEVDPAEKLLNERFGGDAKKAAAAYAELEKLNGRQGNTVGAMRKSLEDAGYTFDAEGNPVAPKQEPAPQVFAGRQLPQGHTIQYVNNEPVEFDKYGAPHITDEQWAEVREADPDLYIEAFTNWSSDRAVKKAHYELAERQRVEDVSKAQRAEVESVIARVPHLSDNKVVQETKATADELFAKLTPEQKLGGVGYDVVFTAVLSQNIGGFVEELTEKIRAQETEKATQNKVVIGRTGGGSGNGSSGQDQEARIKLSSDEDAARLKFNRDTGKNLKPSEWRAYGNG